MKERPIIFNAEMVRAILDGRKTQTRRIVKPRRGWPIEFVGGIGMKDDPTCWGFEDGEGKWWALKGDDQCDQIPCPFGQPGDRLWVRETFRLFDSHEECACYDFCVCARHHGAPIYRADEDDGSKWKPSMHMPRWASRITLEIVSVRVERLHEMNAEDARAEGCPGGHGSIPGYGYSASPCEHFRHVWEPINGTGSWAENPWVWVVEFKRVAQELPK